MDKYRLCAGMVVMNKNRKIFVGKRKDVVRGSNKDKNLVNGWQMPQGGVESEESMAEASLRELKEEIGTDKVNIIAEHIKWLYYDFPERDRHFKSCFNNCYIGQKQKWFLYEFYGEDSDINIAFSKNQEFLAWKWVSIEFVLQNIVLFKKNVYISVFEEFESLIKQNA